MINALDVTKKINYKRDMIGHKVRTFFEPLVEKYNLPCRYVVSKRLKILGYVVKSEVIEEKNLPIKLDVYITDEYVVVSLKHIVNDFKYESINTPTFNQGFNPAIFQQKDFSENPEIVKFLTSFSLRAVEK